ncbi:MAG: hypothetical protein LBT63_02340, partial [Holosporaceae bacterium]|nr:hypothetical protein [Holosporaceae bacterium]
ALWKYNNYRPHAHLNGATPMEYIAANRNSEAVSYVVNLYNMPLLIDQNLGRCYIRSGGGFWYLLGNPCIE